MSNKLDEILRISSYELYREIISRYNKNQIVSNNDLIKEILQILGYNKVNRYISIGPGYSRTPTIFAMLGAEVVIIDKDRKMINFQSEFSKAVNPYLNNIHFICDDIVKADLSNFEASCDVVECLNFNRRDDLMEEVPYILLDLVKDLGLIHANAFGISTGPNNQLIKEIMRIGTQLGYKVDIFKDKVPTTEQYSPRKEGTILQVEKIVTSK